MKGCDNTEEQERALAALGLKPETPLQQDRLDLWPEHMAAVRLFDAAGTQWNVAPRGIVGLRYEALPVLREALAIPAQDWEQVFADLQVLEQEALRIWRARR